VRAGESRRDRQIEQQRAVGHQLRMHRAGKRFDEHRVHPAAAALIRPRRIGEAITHHPLSGEQCRANDVVHMQRASGEHQQGLGHCGDLLGAALEHDAAHAFGQWRAARLASEAHREPLPCEVVSDVLRHRRFAGALDALERDELRAAHG